MEILYIWVKKYRNFIEQGFNFSSEFVFTFDKDSLTESYYLSIKKNPRFIPNFFERKNITNVTAIIGQNGAGKTSILEFIKTQLPSVNQEWETLGIIAFQHRSEKVILIPDSLHIETSKSIEEFKVYKYPFRLPKEADNLFGPLYDNAHYIYYSNIVDLKTEDIFQSGITNLSTLALIKSDNFIQEESIESGQTDSYSKYKANEIRRNVQFILSDDRLFLPFELPEYLYIDWLQGDKKALMKEDKDVLLIVQQFERITDSKYPVQGKENVLNQVYIATMLNTLFTFRKRSSLVIPISLRPMSNEEDIKEYIHDFFLKLGDITYEDENKQVAGVSKFKELSILVPSFFALLEGLFERKVLNIANNPFNGGISLQYAIRTDTENDLKSLLDYYVKIKGITDFFDFNWRSLSSGQQSFFSLLSRFYHLKVTEAGLSQSLIILIDEGDIYFHPQWQKEFFDKTIDYLSRLFPRNEIQFIFASNTPFITSDLPKDNVVFIENIEHQVQQNGNGIVVHGIDNNQRETFAGNIHTLFSDSFYMRGALIGDFARKKIDKIIEYLRSEEIKEGREDYLKTIKIIGEPILKERLLQLWDNKFGTEEEIAHLQKRIAELRKQQ